MLIRTGFLTLCVLLGCSASAPDESYQAGGLWQITITPIKVPAAAKGAKGFTKSECRPALSNASHPKVGRVKQLRSGMVCRVIEISPLGATYRRVDECTVTGNPNPMRVTQVGEQTPTHYELMITTDMPSRPDLEAVVVKEKGVLQGACPAAVQ